MYFLKIREQMADHTHFEASGPTTAAAWLADLDRRSTAVRTGSWKQGHSAVQELSCGPWIDRHADV
jgi:hypothetical protein